MSGFDLLTGLYLLGAAILGGLIGWSVRGRQSGQSINKLGKDWQLRFDKANRQNENLKADVSSLKTSVEAAKTIVQKTFYCGRDEPHSDRIPACQGKHGVEEFVPGQCRERRAQSQDG